MERLRKNMRGGIRVLLLATILLISFVWIISCSDSEVPEWGMDSPGRQEIAAIGLPLVEIETVDFEEPTYEKANKPEGMLGNTIINATSVPGKMRIVCRNEKKYDSGAYVKGKSGITLRVRGNTSALTSPKKPYKITLQQKADLLGRSDKKYENKDWVLLRFDNLKTKVGMWMNELVGMPWTPAEQYVNVILNGRYLGLYTLAENIKRDKECRVDIEKEGFLFEYDAYWWNEGIYIPSKLYRAMQYTLKYPKPEDITSEDVAYLSELLKNVEDALYKDYDKYLDVSSFAAWLLAHDILGNQDSAGSNIFLSKYDRGDSKIQIGPLWDFDKIMETTDEWSNEHKIFYFKIWWERKDKIMLSAYKEKWGMLSDDLFNEIEYRLSSYNASKETKQVNASIIQDNQTWGTTNPPLTESIESIRTWFKQRQEWMKKSIELL